MSDGIDFPGYAVHPGILTLAATRYDARHGGWTEAACEEPRAALRELTLATFNTWFQGPDPALRYAGLLHALRGAGADVIVLQEVNMRLLEAVRATAWVRETYRYVRAPFRSDAVPTHGMMLLSRLPIDKAELHPLPTHMGRSLLAVQCSTEGAPFTFATVHLESMKAYADVRGKQLETVFGILEGASDVLLAGDFNFCSTWTGENSRLDARYADLWPRLRPDEPGLTEDTDVNSMLADAKKETKKVRFDRVLLRSDGPLPRWIPESIRLLGAEPVSPAHPRVFPSDHFGLAATVRRSACL